MVSFDCVREHLIEFWCSPMLGSDEKERAGKQLTVGSCKIGSIIGVCQHWRESAYSTSGCCFRMFSGCFFPDFDWSLSSTGLVFLWSNLLGATDGWHLSHHWTFCCCKILSRLHRHFNEREQDPFRAILLKSLREEASWISHWRCGLPDDLVVSCALLCTLLAGWAGKATSRATRLDDVTT